MKKTRTLLCLLLAAVLLVGLCAPSARAEEARGGTLPMCSFDEMEYKRPSVTLLRFHVMGVDLAIKCEQGYKVVEGALDKCYEDYYRFSTQSSIAYIRSCQDTRDSFYAAENAWCDEQSATMSQLMEDMYYICGMSPMAEELEKRYFWEGFAEEYADDSNSIYDDDTVALLEQEAALVAEYRELVASPTIVWQGEEVDYYSFLEEASSYADYWNALMLYYQTYAPKVADVFIRMVKVRQAQAEKMGYDSYEQMQFEYNYERDYTPEQAAQYLADIKTYIVPLFKQLFESGELYAYEDGPLDTGRLEGVLEAGVRSIGGEAEETFDFMKKYGMYDIAYSINKSNMSFQTYLDDYESPFLFMDAGGTLSDVTTFSHEFGHSLDAYVNYNANETIDLAEVYSQALELLILDRLDGELSEAEIETLRQIKLADILSMYVQQASFAEFERQVYAADPDQLSADWLNDLSLRLAKQYGYYDGYSEQYYAMSWIDIVHFFEVPFYVITYPVSNDLAMQLYAMERAQEGAGLDKYLEILPHETAGVVDTALAGGLQSPFAPGRLRDVAAMLEEEMLASAQSNAA